MFKELQPLAEKSPIAMIISAEGDDLRVIVTQKKAGSGRPLSLSILARPEELDTDLPGAIATASGELAKPAPVADQVKTQVDAARASAKTPPRQSPAKPKAAKPKPAKRSPAPKPAKAKKTIKVKPAAPKKAVAAAGKKEPKLRASRPGAEACIADYLKLKPQYGDKLTRELFMEKAETGRRFERVFGNWSKFVEAAAAPEKDTKMMPLFEDKQIPPAASTSVKVEAPGQWPFPTPGAPVQSATPPASVKPASSQEDAAPAAAAGPGRIVVTRTGTALVSRMEIEAEENMLINVPGHGRYRIVDFDEKKIVVELITREVTA